jgi:TrkA domain protein
VISAYGVVRQDEPVEVHETALPGIGVRYDFTTERGRRLGVVAFRNGGHELALYGARDPDTTTDVVPLTEEESDALAEVLGATRMVERLADLHKQIEGLTTEQVSLPGSSDYTGRPLGDARIRTLTGCSIVAVVRGEQVHAAPRPDFVFQERDVVVMVGTPDGCRKAGEILGVREL